MIIRLADVADAAGIARVHVDTWRTTYRGIVPDEFLAGLSHAQRQAAWERHLAEPSALQCVYVAENDGEVVGFANGGPERSNDPIYRGELYAIYILEPWQHHGIGKAFVMEIARWLVDHGCTSMLVWVLAQNPSRRFYEALGGTYVRNRTITIGGAPLEEVAYGWKDLGTALTRWQGIG